MLLLHGFPESSDVYRNLIPQLAEKYRVLAPDPPGLGTMKKRARGVDAYAFGKICMREQMFDNGTKLTLKVCGLD